LEKSDWNMRSSEREAGLLPPSPVPPPDAAGLGELLAARLLDPLEFLLMPERRVGVPARARSLSRPSCVRSR
jgi:hypothetical protein